MYTVPSDLVNSATLPAPEVNAKQQQQPIPRADQPKNGAISVTGAPVAQQPRIWKTPTAQDPLRVVILHGDPSKPSDILPGGKWDEDDFYTIQRAKEAIATLGPEYTFTWLCNHDSLMQDLRRLKERNEVDLVLQLCDEGWMNNSRMELHIVALLDMFEIPYSGIGPKTMGMTYDKQCILKIAESIGIPVPKSYFLEEGDDFDPKRFQLEYPVMVKPNSTDGSYGITAKNVCYNLEQLRIAIDQIRNFFYVKGPILLQEYLTGRDVNVGVMERKNQEKGIFEPWVLPISEEDYSALPDDLPKICGFESKWDESSPYYKIKTRPTTLSAEKQQQLAMYTQRLFQRIECHDYARFDWRLDGNGNPRLLEANPNCGWCWDGHLPKTAALCGVSYGQFFEMIIQSAWDRAGRQAKAKEDEKAGKKFVMVGSNGAEGLLKP